MKEKLLSLSPKENIEKKWHDQFLTIAGYIYKAYTGLDIPLSDTTDICTPSGVCVEESLITSTPQTNIQPLTVINFLSNLYKSHTFKTANDT